MCPIFTSLETDDATQGQFTDEQIIRALREIDGGAKQRDVARRLGVTEQTLCRWKERFGAAVA